MKINTTIKTNIVHAPAWAEVINNLTLNNMRAALTS